MTTIATRNASIPTETPTIAPVLCANPSLSVCPDPRTPDLTGISIDNEVELVSDVEVAKTVENVVVCVYKLVEFEIKVVKVVLVVVSVVIVVEVVIVVLVFVFGGVRCDWVVVDVWPLVDEVVLDDDVVVVLEVVSEEVVVEVDDDVSVEVDVLEEVEEGEVLDDKPTSRETSIKDDAIEASSSAETEAAIRL